MIKNVIIPETAEQIEAVGAWCAENKIKPEWSTSVAVDVDNRIIHLHQVLTDTAEDEFPAGLLVRHLQGILGTRLFSVGLNFDDEDVSLARVLVERYVEMRTEPDDSICA